MTIKTSIQLIRLTRFWQWWDKVQTVFIAAFILLLFTDNPQNKIGLLIGVGVYMLFLGSYGYVLNSYADREQDTKVGKNPEAAYFSKTQHQLITLLFAIGTIIIPLLYASDLVKAIGLITFLLTTFYSIRLIRFKERGILGIIVATLPQRPLPFLLFAALISSDYILIGYLAGWLTLLGLATEMVHQLLDFENDLKAEVNTWAQNIGYKKTLNSTLLTIIILLIYFCLTPMLFSLIYGAAISFILILFSSPLFYMSIPLKKHIL